jgi:hypothetical protein
MDKRYQVFISSTFDDLKDERQAVLKAILEINHMPAGMELFPASDDTAWRLICDVIDASDYYVLIVGGRYGSLDEAGIGFTEKEYDYALSKKKPIIAVLHSNPDNLPRGKTETSESAWQKLQQFRKKIEKNHTCTYWNSPDELKVRVILGLTHEIKSHPAQGWIRAGSLLSQEASNEIIRLRNIIDQQREEIEHLGSRPPEGADSLAQGNDELAIEFKATFYKENGRRDDVARTIVNTDTVHVSWNDLFGAFAPNLVNPLAETKVRANILGLMKEKANRLKEANRGYTLAVVKIPESIFQTIKVQFKALGLIDLQTDRHITENRYGEKNQKDIPTWSLTPLGQAQLYKVKAIYRESEKD